MAVAFVRLLFSIISPRLILLICLSLGVYGQFEWQNRDAFDEVRLQMDKVNRDNCQIKHVGDLYLPDDSVSHTPDIKDVNINPVFPNRTSLLHLHNMALSRAFFWSYILQSRFIRPAINDTYDPGMMYYFLSTVADVSTNPTVNASAIYFSPNMSYSSSYRGFFNKTFPRFAPRTFRADDFNDPIHLERISTWNTFTVQDLGAVDLNTSRDYTSNYYRINEWYKFWLPDKVVGRHDTKTTYQVEIRYANNTNETFTFHGPPGADEVPGPVRWTRPYFDCERSNRWLVAAVVPIADIYPRHTGFRHIEYPTYTAVSVVEMDYDRIDINQCPKGKGNNGPNKFANSSRCKQETTECEPIHGWGFRKGGYQCRCRPGYRLPFNVRRPYLGELVERATAEQYYNGFDCLKIGYVQRLPVQWEKAPKDERDYYMEKYPEYGKNASRGADALKSPKMNVHRVLDFILGMKKDNCKNYKPEDLVLSGGYDFGAEEYFANEAKMALRLANFISAFLQVSDPKEMFSGKRVADRPLTEDQMVAETLSIVLGNSRIWSAGTYWERNKFTNRTYFAPYAYKTTLNTRKFFVEDLARLNKSDEIYSNKPWYRFLKQRWSTNFDALEKYWMKIKIRFDENGETFRKYEHFPNFYMGAKLEHGHWSSPYYDCNGKHPMWKIKYGAPFFGWDSLKARLEFKGVVAVTMDMLKLDINQCPDYYYVPNAFKDTNKCEKRSSLCVPILGRGFESGGYKCECKQGYEYPFEDQITYYDGQLLEAEFINLVDNNETRFDMFKCRRAGADALYIDKFLLALLTVLSYLSSSTNF